MPKKLNEWAERIQDCFARNDEEGIKAALDDASYKGNVYTQAGPADTHNSGIKDKYYQDSQFTIEATNVYDRDGAEIKNEDRVFLTYWKGSDGQRTLTEKTFDQMMQESLPKKNPIQKPAKPKLGFFASLRHALSFIFGEPDAIKEHNRAMEVFRAKKMDAIEDHYGLYGRFEFDRRLLDEKYAGNYIKNTLPKPVKAASQEEAPKSREISEEDKLFFDKLRPKFRTNSSGFLAYLIASRDLTKENREYMNMEYFADNAVPRQLREMEMSKNTAERNMSLVVGSYLSEITGNQETFRKTFDQLHTIEKELYKHEKEESYWKKWGTEGDIPTRLIMFELLKGCALAQGRISPRDIFESLKNGDDDAYKNYCAAMKSADRTKVAEVLKPIINKKKEYVLGE